MNRYQALKTILAGGVCALAIAGSATAQTRSFNVPAGDLKAAIDAYIQQSGTQVIYRSDDVRGKKTSGIHGALSAVEALNELLAGSDLGATRDPSGAVVLVERPKSFAPAAAAAAPSASTVGEVVVTATRIVRNGYQAPTPTTVLSASNIAADAPSNIANYVDELPQVIGGYSPRAEIGNISAGITGINTTSLRNLGGNRTLVLLDGERVGAATTGTGATGNQVDINEFPEELIKRIDVVTGGASADWGSDAVAGVVNYVLDKTFTGVKGEIQSGVSTYGDDANYKVSLTLGSGFANDRGHILIAAEDAYNEGVSGTPRPWANENNNKLLYPNPAYVAGNGQPQFIVASNSGFSNGTPGGIITSGPLMGTYFGPGGTPAQFHYGTVSGSYMQGGQAGYANEFNTVDLDPRMQRDNLFFRSSFDVSNHLQVFAQASYAEANTFQHVSDDTYLGNLTISATNPFIPTSTAAAIAAYNAIHPATPITSFKFGTFNTDLGPAYDTSNRSNGRFVLGVSGDFDALGSNWTWDAYAEETITDLYYSGHLPITANYMSAINVVKNPTTGAPQCASVATNPSCVPYDVFGTGVNNASAVNYVLGNAWLRQQLNQNVESASLHGNPISDWAGPISVAAGVEYRDERIAGESDPIDAAALATSVANHTALVSPFYAGNFHPTFGEYHVTEGFLETVVPLAKDLPFAKSLDFNGAVRETDYSTSGMVTTWKVGLTWTPIDDISFRASRSHDIRAPDLSELFTTAQSTLTTVVDATLHGTPTDSVYQVSEGNPNLKPEVSDTSEVGVIFRPRFLPGFEASVDYYSDIITDAVYSASAQQIVNECAEADAEACSLIVRPGGPGTAITQVNVAPINLAGQVARGVDYEASYSRRLDTVLPFLKGTLTLRGMATNFLQNTINPGIPGVAVFNYAGNNSGNGEYGTQSLPHWKFSATATWEDGPLTASLTGRGISDGQISSQYVACTTACPVSTINHETINDNSLPGALYFDGSIAYKLPRGIEVYAVVDNMFDVAPVMVPYPSSSGAPLSINPFLYDTLGRMFRVGVRFKM